jgi:hypothetical protein
MRKLGWLVAATAVTYGCASDSKDPPAGGQTDEIGAQASDQHGVEVSGSPAPSGACSTTAAPGTVLQRVQLPLGSIGTSFSTNASGDVAFNFVKAIGFDRDTGVTRLDANLDHVFDYPHGDVVALDAEGNAYVAGGFSAPTDFGTGVITPAGNIDVFVAKLSPTGEVLAVYVLPDCGDGVSDIAVSADGRIAVSGSAMGTVVLDANGDVIFRVELGGKLAFTPDGNLVVGATLKAAGAADTDAFVVELDAAGNTVFSHQYTDAALPVDVGGYGGFVTVTEPTDQEITDVAVSANGQIGVAGTFFRQMSIGGMTAREGSAFPSGSQLGTFTVVLDAAGNELAGGEGQAVNLGLSRNGAIALTATGQLVVSSNSPGNAQGPFAYPELHGAGINIGNGAGIAGFGLGVGFDACGNVLWADQHNEPSILDAHSFISRIAL